MPQHIGADRCIPGLYSTHHVGSAATYLDILAYPRLPSHSAPRLDKPLRATSEHSKPQLPCRSSPCLSTKEHISAHLDCRSVPHRTEPIRDDPKRAKTASPGQNSSGRIVPIAQQCYPRLPQLSRPSRARSLLDAPMLNIPQLPDPTVAHHSAPCPADPMQDPTQLPHHVLSCPVFPRLNSPYLPSHIRTRLTKRSYFQRIYR